MKNFQISVQGVLQVPKTQFLGAVLVPCVQLKHHNFGRWESFEGLANTPRMSFLYASFDGGADAANILHIEVKHLTWDSGFKHFKRFNSETRDNLIYLNYYKTNTFLQSSYQF